MHRLSTQSTGHINSVQAHAASMRLANFSGPTVVLATRRSDSTEWFADAVRDILSREDDAQDNAQKPADDERGDQESDKSAVTASPGRLSPHIPLGENALEWTRGCVRRQWGPAVPAEISAGNVGVEAGNADFEILRIMAFRCRCRARAFHIER